MSQISYQLFSSRKFPPLSDTLRMLRELGYRHVEGYGGLFGDEALVADLAGLLEETGLAMPSGHFGLDQLENEPDRVISFARRLGLATILCPHLAADRRPSDAAGYSQFGAHLEAVSAPYRDAGFAFGWHNHDFEFQPFADGSVPMERLLDAAPGIGWEADIAWIAKAGADPFEWIASHGDRMIAVHVKDIAAAGECIDEDGWADVGHGTLDWPGLMKALRKTPARLFVMEHDNPADDQRFARRSLAAMRSF